MTTIMAAPRRAREYGTPLAGTVAMGRWGAGRFALSGLTRLLFQDAADQRAIPKFCPPEVEQEARQVISLQGRHVYLPPPPQPVKDYKFSPKVAQKNSLERICAWPI
eukprot:762561-Hanusia_phi.AAC.6